MNPPGVPHGPVRPPRLPLAFFLTCRRYGVRPTPHVLLVRLAPQRLWLFRQQTPAPATPNPTRSPYRPLRSFVISSSRFGIGEIAGSNMTPRGLHRIARKIGGGWPQGAIFKSRQFVGYTWQGQPHAAIVHRILWLAGLEPGFNQGPQRDTFQRYIYIHGFGDETTLGRPASHGCIHLAAGDLLPLYETLPEGTLVWISADGCPLRDLKS